MVSYVIVCGTLMRLTIQVHIFPAKAASVVDFDPITVDSMPSDDVVIVPEPDQCLPNSVSDSDHLIELSSYV